jgi:site-specific recombinase XerD
VTADPNQVGQVLHIWEENGDLRLTQHLMGHSGPNTTAIFTHVTPRKERERLAEYLK